jgi:hypothetical protein
MWRFPLIRRIPRRAKVTSQTSRTQNRFGGAISAASFLQFFVEDTAWAHIDMAGQTSSTREGRFGEGIDGIPTTRSSTSCWTGHSVGLESPLRKEEHRWKQAVNGQRST